MGNSISVTENKQTFINKEDALGFYSPKKFQKKKIDLLIKTSGSFGSSDKICGSNKIKKRSSSLKRLSNNNNFDKLEVFNRTNSPTSSRSSGSNSLMTNKFLNGNNAEKTCLRKSTEPKFQINGDLNSQQISVVKQTWKQVMKSVNDDETEIATRLLLRIFQLDPKIQTYFSLSGIPQSELRHNPIFIRHVRTFEPTLIHVMNHPTHATSLSKYLQHLGGRHVQHTGVTYKCSYWKTFVKALIEIVSADHSSTKIYDAFLTLGEFCVEQMKIGYKIEYKLLREAERLSLAQDRKRQNNKKINFM